ncbi:Myb-like DNA-binding domain containing protein [Trichomonas vaginalis G3]|uniref:Myb-like DNA-binding domain containing protein n=1 Tax=Trichomonas vaginalis (strain ATCC PRA-98 / G3) TaxID=412133 RepID=A2E2M3_TRIV3|nr:RNA polymerase II transcription regulator recruiting protein [Trichomonas vaginalis G3]EAY13051.1 Myb-like DNA-binding domain containing protein [Trichomonas vaginalis G3]KAI5548239.1 RNA polymerase II transcription regulator recruiting protein [Trichomonas vaginalis G3]|eukprot:XP_001325274.1 Myb-like DNA-binding domain containing protein [Trichomonas vaginalis G3]
MDVIQELNRKNNSFGKPHPKTQFTSVEDARLKKYVHLYGDTDWNLISKMMITRNPRQCRERWNKFLSNSINKEPWTEEENTLLIKKYKELGPKWMKISRYFNARTDVYLKNRWNIIMRKEKLKQKQELLEKALQEKREKEFFQVLDEKFECTDFCELFDPNTNAVDQEQLSNAFRM